jgi:hypothetical protein
VNRYNGAGWAVIAAPTQGHRAGMTLPFRRAVLPDGQQALGASLIICGKKIGYAAIRGKEIDHRPHIAGYCRILPRNGTWGKKNESKVQCPKSKATRGRRLIGKNCRSYRFVPAGTAWYRLVPDKFFSPRKKPGENHRLGLWLSFAGTPRVGVGRCFHTGNVPLRAALELAEGLGS